MAAAYAAGMSPAEDGLAARALAACLTIPTLSHPDPGRVDHAEAAHPQRDRPVGVDEVVEVEALLHATDVRESW